MGGVRDWSARNKLIRIGNVYDVTTRRLGRKLRRPVKMVRYRESAEGKARRMEATRERRRLYQGSPEQHARKLEVRRNHSKTESGKTSARVKDARKRAGLRRAALNMTMFDRFVYREMIQHAKDMETLSGEVHHIDHIVPLRHKKACGLHNSFNWQVVPASWNLQKGASNMEEYEV